MDWRVWIKMAESTETEETITTDATATDAPAPKVPRNWLSIGDEETTFEGKMMSLSEAQRRAHVRDVETAMSHRAETEKWYAANDETAKRNAATLERNVAAQERQAKALESIAETVRSMSRTLK